MQRVTVRAAAAAAAALRPPATKTNITGAFSVSVAQILDGRARQYEHVQARAPVLSAVERMSVNGVGSLIVLDAGMMEGIVTERDILVNIPRIMQPETPLSVGEIMSRNPVTIDAAATIGECMAIMSDNNFRHLPVTDENELVGVVSIRDLVNQVAKDHHHEVSRLSTELNKLASVLGNEPVTPAQPWPARVREFFSARSSPNMS